MQRLELFVLLTVIALGAWLGNARQKLALTWSISPNEDGSRGYAVRVHGNQCQGQRSGTYRRGIGAEIHEALDGALAWNFTFTKAGSSPSLYTPAWIRRGHQSVELRWYGGV